MCSSGFGDRDNQYLVQAITLFNIQVLPSDAISVESVLFSPIKQRTLSQKLDNCLFQTLLVSSSVANKARILSESAPHSASWLSVVPSAALGLHLEPNEFLVALKWWLGQDLSRGSLCPLCPDTALDPLGHHAVTCRRGGDVVMRLDWLRDIIIDFCHSAHLGVKVEVGSQLKSDLRQTRPADVLVVDWERGRPAVWDVTVASPLTPAVLNEAGMTAGAAGEQCKYITNDPKCQELGWLCVPLAVKTYGNWGREAHTTFTRLATRLAICVSLPKSKVTTDLFGRLSLVLTRSIAKAILSRSLPQSFE